MAWILFVVGAIIALLGSIGEWPLEDFEPVALAVCLIGFGLAAVYAQPWYEARSR